MRKISILLTILLVTTTNSHVFAKKDKKLEAEKKAHKAEIKEWTKRKKQMDPLQLKALIEENHNLKMLNQKLEEEGKVYKEELEKTVKLKTELETLQKAYSMEDEALATREVDEMKGLVFKVQVGVYKDYWQANKVKEELRAQGKKTWIIVFKDGKRVPLKEVLNQVIPKTSNKKK